MTRNKIASALGAVVTVTALALPAAAQAGDRWMPRELAVERLERGLGAARTAVGVAAGGQAVIELFVTPGGDWRVLATRTDGLSCVTGEGEAWTPQEPAVGEPI